MEPNNQAFLRLLDYSAAIIYGAVSSLFIALLIPASWHMAVGMVVGMIIAMSLLLPLAFLLSTTLGGFQVIMPAMAIGMVNGMVLGMMADQEFFTIMRLGIIFGILVQFTLHMYDLKLHGEQVRSER